MNDTVVNSKGCERDAYVRWREENLWGITVPGRRLQGVQNEKGACSKYS